GSTFTWTGLTGVQQGNLNNDINILNYLRGDGVNEVANGGLLRDRVRYTVGAVQGGVLGDIVNGSPIKGPSAGGGFDRLPSGSPGQASYATYRSTGNTALDNMRDTIFLGANDGMLHAFNRLDGVERFAFVPNSVFSVPRSPILAEAKLKMLSDPAYAHRYTVDGPPQIGDAFIGPNAAASSWKTLLLGSTGAGARSVFAMDVTNPAVVAGGFDQTKLLWEFSEVNNADMGYVISYPHIARMRDGRWVAIFGNGYDSLNGQAKLFILDLQTGAVVWQQSVGAAGGNGLSQPNFTVNNEREVTAIYAGDLKGNLWKFDVDNADPTQWKVAFGGPPNYTPLFAGSANQPISVMPELTFHPNAGVLVSFGTGKLFETEDTATTLPPNVNRNIQAIYGIWDKPGEITGFSGNSTLVQQTANTSLAAAADASLSGTTSLAVDWSTKRGWYLNLASGGERVNVNPQQAKSTLLVVSNTPDIDPCKSGGASRIFALDPITGGAPNFGVLDANGSGTITAADKGYNVKSITFAVLSLPALQTRKTVTDQIVTERVGTRGQTGERLGGVENRPASATDCAQWLLAGGSDASIAGFDIALCATGKPRISWRQLQ
ncbi:MAG: PilC/PilY family type IV pilus protein, partial [Rhizobacter sp.]|nr:PilC/PilY family type IV pilus protein [Rhizobacter sp.]